MSSDNDLRNAVIAELKWEPSVTAAHLGVTARDGVIALSGHVGSYAEKHAAEAAAARVKGVRAIAEEIEVQLPLHGARSDEDIAAAAVHHMGWDVSIPRDAVAVKVERGWVTLTGKVDWHFQKAAAVQEVTRLAGVVGVSDEIVIRPQVDAARLVDDITHAMGRSWFFNRETITVRAEGGKVHLGGTTRSLHEKQVAASTAWAAPGVVAVENDIAVL